MSTIKYMGKITMRHLTSSAETTNLDLLSNQELEILFNNILFLYKQSQPDNPNTQSQKLISDLQSYSHLLDKREILKSYLRHEENGILCNSDEGLFATAHSEITQLRSDLLEGRQPRRFGGTVGATKLPCPLAPGIFKLKKPGKTTIDIYNPLEEEKQFRQYVCTPKLITYTNANGQPHSVIVDLDNLNLLIGAALEKIPNANQAALKNTAYVKIGDTRVFFKTLYAHSSPAASLKRQGIATISGDKMSVVIEGERPPTYTEATTQQTLWQQQRPLTPTAPEPEPTMSLTTDP
jgi:hypothetical protein